MNLYSKTEHTDEQRLACCLYATHFTATMGKLLSFWKGKEGVTGVNFRLYLITYTVIAEL